MCQVTPKGKSRETCYLLLKNIKDYNVNITSQLGVYF